MKLGERFTNTRLLMYAFIYFGYATYYIGRKGFLFSLPWIMKDLNLSVSSAGILISIFTACYGFGKFFGGILVDRFRNSGRVMGIGLILVGVLSFAASYSSGMTSLIILAGLNGCVQALGWPPCARVLSNWFEDKNRGKYWSIWSTSYAVGETVAPWIILFFMSRSGWRAALISIACICAVVGVCIFIFLKDSPEEYGLINKNNKKSNKLKKNLSIMEILRVVVSSRKIIMLCAGYFLVQFIRTGISDWVVFYAIQMFSSARIASVATSLFSLGGIILLPVWGWLADKSFRKHESRVPVTIFCLASLSIVILLGQWLGFISYIFYFLMVFMAGALIFGPQMLTGMIAVDVIGEQLSGTVTGFVGLFAYLGSAFAGYPLGLIIQMFGWSMYYYIIGIASIVGCIIYIMVFKEKRR
ncbi:MAG: MFS transporter [Chlamydiia bacterium]|nr:MFS transporter [Chlamydiia bacterium]